jgi:hypothetical protein
LIELPEQLSSSARQIHRYGITGLAMHLAGAALGTLSISLVLSGRIGIESGVAVLTPFADALFGLGIVIVVAAAARASVPMKCLVVIGTIIGLGLFFKSAPHEFHIASGLGFGLPHNGHTVLGLIMITVSVVVIAALALAYNRSVQRSAMK